MEPHTPNEHLDTVLRHDQSELKGDVPADTPVVTDNLAKQHATKPRFIDRITNGMSWYGVELVLSVVGLMITTGVITYAIYAVINHMKGIDNPLAVRYLGEFSLWIAASMVIWLPLAVVFYLRTRAELQRHPATKERLVHKLFVGYFSFNVVLVIVGTLFSVVYALIRIAVGVDDQAGDTAIRTVLPGLLTATLMTGLFWAYGRHEGVSRKVFALLITSVGIVVTIALLAMSVSNVQGANRDEKAASDLSEIHSQISSYYNNKRALPTALTELDRLKSDTKARLSRYDYKKDGATKYQLCATFVTNTQKQQGYEASVRYNNDDYTTYASFSIHGTGEKCFKLTTSLSSYYDDYMDGSLFDTSNDSSSY